MPSLNIALSHTCNWHKNLGNKWYNSAYNNDHLSNTTSLSQLYFSTIWLIIVRPPHKDNHSFKLQVVILWKFH